MRALEQRPIKFNNTCGCIVDLKLLEQSILWYQSSITNSSKKIYMYGRYPCVTIGESKIHVHRLIMQFTCKRKLSRHEYCHHINGNKLDSSISNLSIMSSIDHQSYHNKGKKLSDSHRQRISISNSTRVKRNNRNYIDDEIVLKMFK